MIRVIVEDGRPVDVDTDDETEARAAAEKWAAANPIGKDRVKQELGATARSLIEGPPSFFGELAGAPGNLYNLGAHLMGSDSRWPLMHPNEAISELATRAGLPEPQGAVQSIAQGGIKALGSGAPLIAAGKRLAAGAPGVMSRIGNVLAERPWAQGGGAVGAGTAMEASRELGGGPMMQLGSALAGGALGAYGGVGAGRATEGFSAALRRFTQPQQIEAQVRVTLENAGIDWATLHPAVQAELVRDVSAAISMGRPLDPQALARLADYRAIDATPRRGPVTQDPRLITREKNLEKTQAQLMLSPGPDLAAISNANAQRVDSTLRGLGGSTMDDFATGEGIISRVRGMDRNLERGVDEAYAAARAAPGREIPLSPRDFSERMWRNLDEDGVAVFAPKEVMNYIRQIEQGELPFNVQTIDVLRKMISGEYSPTMSGNAKRALGAISKALDEAELKTGQFGGNQVVTQETARVLREIGEQPPEAVRILNRARALHKGRKDWQESSQFIEDALSGAAPDTFVKQQIISRPLNNLRGVIELVGDEPAMRDAIRNQLIEHIRGAGGLRPVGSGAADRIKLNADSMEKALHQIGRRKLELVFTPEEVRQLYAAVRVGVYETAQPPGTAVNNSNSAAMIIGQLLDKLRTVAANTPAVKWPVGAVDVAFGTRGAINMGSALAGRPPPITGFNEAFGGAVGYPGVLREPR